MAADVLSIIESPGGPSRWRASPRSGAAQGAGLRARTPAWRVAAALGDDRPAARHRVPAAATAGAIGMNRVRHHRHAAAAPSCVRVAAGVRPAWSLGPEG